MVHFTNYASESSAQLLPNKKSGQKHSGKITESTTNFYEKYSNCLQKGDGSHLALNDTLKKMDSRGKANLLCHALAKEDKITTQEMYSIFKGTPNLKNLIAKRIVELNKAFKNLSAKDKISLRGAILNTVSSCSSAEGAFARLREFITQTTYSPLFSKNEKNLIQKTLKDYKHDRIERFKTFEQFQCLCVKENGLNILSWIFNPSTKLCFAPDNKIIFFTIVPTLVSEKGEYTYYKKLGSINPYCIDSPVKLFDTDKELDNNFSSIDSISVLPDNKWIIVRSENDNTSGCYRFFNEQDEQIDTSLTYPFYANDKEALFFYNDNKLFCCSRDDKNRLMVQSVESNRFKTQISQESSIAYAIAHDNKWLVSIEKNEQNQLFFKRYELTNVNQITKNFGKKLGTVSDFLQLLISPHYVFVLLVDREKDQLAFIESASLLQNSEDIILHPFPFKILGKKLMFHPTNDTILIDFMSGYLRILNLKEDFSLEELCIKKDNFSNVPCFSFDGSRIATVSLSEEEGAVNIFGEFSASCLKNIDELISKLLDQDFMPAIKKIKKEAIKG